MGQTDHQKRKSIHPEVVSKSISMLKDTKYSQVNGQGQGCCYYSQNGTFLEFSNRFLCLTFLVSCS